MPKLCPYTCSSFPPPAGAFDVKIPVASRAGRKLKPDCSEPELPPGILISMVLSRPLPRGNLHLREVSETHWLCWQALSPTVTIAEGSAYPKLAPISVTVATPTVATSSRGLTASIVGGA